MFISTHHRTLLAFDLRTGSLRQVKAMPETGSSLVVVDVPESTVTRLQSEGIGNLHAAFIGGGPLDGCEYIGNGAPGTFLLRKNGFFGGAEQVSDAILFDRELARAWEVFQFVSYEAGLNLLRPIQDMHAFAERVRLLRHDGRPVCLHFGCGPRRIVGFLNIDKHPYLTHSDDYFNFDFAEQPWPIPDACVDYIYSEDFIEHIPQKNQIAYLAESFRVLKPGCYNRVNTPCLRASMTQSDFAKGFSGVYFEEFDRWNHIALFTPESLRELALMIGYSHVFFTAKSRGTSAYAVPDSRPGGERNELVGNIFADLLK